MHIDLGPFRLVRPIGKGGMGVVWHGVHIDSGIPVAVKVITQRVSRDERTLKAFRNEVRAVAGLDHPGVVWVLDYGEVPEDASRESGRQLTRGSPYLVMEMATGGTLTSFKQGLPWAELRSMLLVLLEALGHAHARGVIHRDLKPGNVLVCAPSDLRPGLKLTDFGIAHAREETVSDSMSNHVIGTLHYMAPEQIRADWRDYGPWTDLYALGTIAYRLASASLPFQGKRGASLMVAQLNHRPPPLHAVHPMPDGFEDWLHTMLRKEHWRRFQCAADAAHALSSLLAPDLPDRPSNQPDPVARRSVLVTDGPSALDDDPHTLEILDDGGEETATGPSAFTGASEVSSPVLARRRGELDKLRPALPTSWKRPPEANDAGIHLRGAGLGLHGLRSLPLVGRTQERNLLWDTLHDVVRTRQTRVVVVQGTKGTGKTELVRWITQRAVEAGGAHLLRCDFSADDQPQDGLRNMLRRFFRVARLAGPDRVARVIEVCDAFGETDQVDAGRLEKLLDAADPTATDGGLRHSTLRWFFGKLASDRPLVLWFDDAHFGMDGLQLVNSMARSPNARVLVVIAADTDKLKERSLEQSILQRLLALEPTRSLTLGPLTDAELVQHVQENLGLVRSLAEQVARRAAGNPQFATQMVGEWIDADALQRSPDGFVLKRGAALPGTLHQVWEDRLAQILDGLPDHTQSMLEIAAALGDEIDEDEWGLCCDDPFGARQAAGKGSIIADDAQLRAILMERLLTRRLAVEHAHGFTFTEGEVRERLLDRARLEGRFTDHHRAIAAVVRAGNGSPERLGRHLVAAEDVDAGVAALLEGVRQRLTTVGPRPALELLESADTMLSGVAETDPRRGEIWCMRAEIALQRGRFSEVLRWTAPILAQSSDAWRPTVARAHFLMGGVALLRRESEPARQAFERFESLAPSNRFRLQRAAMRHALSLLAEADGRAAEASEHAAEAAHWLTFANATLRDVWSLFGIRGLLSARAGTLLANLERRRNCYEVDGQLESLAECWALLARASRQGNKADLAERCLEHAARLFTQVGSPQAHHTRLQMSLLRVIANDYAGAEDHAVEVANSVRDAHRKPVLLKAHALLATCAAGRGRWTLLGDHLLVIERLIVETSVADKEVGWALQRAGDLARRARKSEAARDAWRLAIDQYQQSGDEETANRLASHLGKL